jgi:pimeloyl-ACP methyl ester carboxylesterase
MNDLFAPSAPVVACAGVCGVLSIAAWWHWRRSVTAVQPHDLSESVKSRFVRLSDAHRRASVHCFVGAPAEPKATLLFVHGFGCNALEFAPVLLELAKFNTVVAPDRVLFQRDGVSTRDRSCDTIADELRDLLDQLVSSGDIDASLPLFVVGHSYGGLLAQHFAMKHGGVAGLVLVDPAHEDQWRFLPADFVFGFSLSPVVFGLFKATAWLGLPRLVSGFLPFPPLHLYPLPERTLAQKAYTELDGGVWRRVADELSGCGVGMEQTRKLRLQRHLPQRVTILIATARAPSPTFFPQRVTDAFLKLARPLAQPPSAVIQATRSNHWIHVEEPQLVIEAVREMLTAHEEAQPTRR